MRFTRTTIGAVALAAITLPAGAQSERDAERRAREVEERARARTTNVWISRDDEDEDRAMLGVSTGSAGERDTLGLLITNITPGSPAEKAGLEEGNRIAAINSTSLRLSAADAGEPDMNGVMSRRLTREMRKLKAGDVVTLRVWQDGGFRDVKVTTVAADELRPRRTRVTREDADDRAVIGVSANGTGSDRDTLGIMVQSVAEDGPAEKAGIFEGARIQSINGVNLRVSADDAGDHAVASARANRFVREMAKVKAGEDVELRVYSNGEVRTIRVRAARAADVYKERNQYWFGGDIGAVMVPPMPPMAPMPPMPMTPLTPRARVMVAPRVELRSRPRVWEMNLERDLERAVEGALAGVRAAESAEEIEDAPEADDADDAPAVRFERSTPRATIAPAAPAASFMVKTSWTPSATPAAAAPAVRISAPRGLSLPGLRASPMDDDLASYFGNDTSIGDGLLVLEADARWEALRVGDVIVEVNGRRVKSGSPVCLDRTRDNRVTVVRKGRRESLVVRAV